jgi:quinolinate synthase
VHPECAEGITDIADAVLSTSQMLRYCQKSPLKKFIIGTEMGLLHRLRVTMPDKEFNQPSMGLVCPNMKMTELKDVHDSLKEVKTVIEVPEEIRLKALRSLDRMLSMGATC